MTQQAFEGDRIHVTQFWTEIFEFERCWKKHDVTWLRPTSNGPYIQMHDNPARYPYRWKKNHMWPIRNSTFEFYMGNMVKYGFTVGDARTLDNIEPEVNRM